MDNAWKHDHYLKGALWCSCGGRLWYQIATGRSDTYPYFYCSKKCGQPYAPAALEEQVAGFYGGLALSDDLKADIRIRLELEITEREKGRASKVQWLSKRLEKLARERDKVMTAYYADAIDTLVLKREQERIRQDTLEMEAQLEAATADLREQTLSIELAIELLDAMQETYERAGEEVRRQFNRALFDRMVVHEEGVHATLNEPFRQLLEPSGSRWTGSVETIGLEPTTSWMQTRRSPS